MPPSTWSVAPVMNAASASARNTTALATSSGRPSWGSGCISFWAAATCSRAESETRALLSGAHGAIRLATACLHSYRWLPSLLKSFSQAWPGVDVTVVAEATEAPCEWLAERKLDVALVADETARDARVRLAPLFRDELVALVGRGHPWFTRRAVDVRAFAEQHVWADAGAFRRDTPLGRALAEAGGVAPRKLTVVPMTAGVPVEMARANLGITLGALWTVEPALTAGDLRAVRLGPRGLWLEWALATRAETPEPALAAFLDALRAHHPRAHAPRARSARGARRPGARAAG